MNAHDDAGTNGTRTTGARAASWSWERVTRAWPRPSSSPPGPGGATTSR
jgi:hypothetical protein